MTAFLVGVAFFLVANLAGGLVRVIRGPTQADRVIAAQLFGTTGVAILLVLSVAADSRPLMDTALIFALLAVVMTVVFVKRGWVRAPGTPTAPEDA
ncbi:MAG: multiple resistance and pH regulation protein F [Gemmatimonadales bacterium]|nr:MAG: multiple resistance and pH regulation protein F [Gemmatimonadales bacterium]